MDAVVVEAGESRQTSRNGGRRGGAAGAGLRGGHEVADPGVDVMPLRGEGMHAKVHAPGCPRLKVAAIRRRGVSWVPTSHPVARPMKGSSSAVPGRRSSGSGRTAGTGAVTATVMGTKVTTTKLSAGGHDWRCLISWQ